MKNQITTHFFTLVQISPLPDSIVKEIPTFHLIKFSATSMFYVLE